MAEIGGSAALLALLAFLDVAHGINVYYAHEDLKQDFPSGLQIKNPPNLTSQAVGICMRFKPYVLKPTYAVTSRKPITAPGQSQQWYFATVFNTNLHDPEFADVNWVAFTHWYMLRIIWSPMQWNHFCFTYDGKAKRVSIVANGGQAVVNRTDEQLPEDALREDFFSLLWAGKNSETFGGAKSLVGEISDVNGWDRALSVEEMVQWTKCEGNQEGNVVRLSRYDDYATPVLTLS